MKCGRQFFPTSDLQRAAGDLTERPVFPEKLTDRLTGKEIPFSNRDNIRQNILKFLLEDKGYRKDDILPDREIRFELEGQSVLSLVDISIVLGGKTAMIWKCASGSLVSRERQVIASARLLEEYLVPFAAVTNGADLEFLDTSTEKVIGRGFMSVPSREELIEELEGIVLRPVNKKKTILEQRILYTYDSISCPATCNKPLER